MALKPETQLPAGTVERVDPDTGEILTVKAITVSQQAAGGVVINGQTFNLVKRVNLPTLKQDSGEVVVFRIDAPIRQEKSERETEVTVAGVKTKATEETTINVVRVTEATSGQPFEYVCNAMTADNLRSAYPDHDYVGKCFAVQKLGVVAGKRYKETNVIEIEAPEGLAPPQP